MLKTLAPFICFAESIVALKIFLNPAALPASIPASCRGALSTNIACGPSLVRPQDLDKGVPFDDVFLTEYCNSTCTASVQTFTTTISTRCGNTRYAFPGINITRSGNDFALPFQWAHRAVCQKGGAKSEYCYPDVINRTLTACDDCSLKYWAGMLNSTYGARKISEPGFKSILSSCSVASTKYPFSTPSPATPVPAATTMPVRRCAGSLYTVKNGDTCKSIAAANSLAIDRFLADNSYDFDCTYMSAGDSVCIQDGCKLHTIQPGETCKQILAAQPFTMNELVAWNPIMETGCSNTTYLQGRTICITPPGTDNYDVPITASFGWSWTRPAGSWVPGPTSGVPLGNSSTFFQPTIPTTSLTRGQGPDPTAYYANCPITGPDYDNGFDWELVPAACRAVLEPYCNPKLTGTPLPQTTFPSSCMPSALLPTEGPSEL